MRYRENARTLQYTTCLLLCVVPEVRKAPLHLVDSVFDHVDARHATLHFVDRVFQHLDVALVPINLSSNLLILVDGLAGCLDQSFHPGGQDVNGMKAVHL